MFNRKKLAVPSVLLASVLFLSAGVTQAAYANDASGSEEVSVEAVKETPAEALAEETKKAEEVSAIPEKDMQTTPVGDPVVAPAPLVEPAPAPVVPEPAAPAPAPAEPKVETPVAPAAPDAPVANLVPDVAIDNPAPSTPVADAVLEDVPAVEGETPPGESESTEAWNIQIQTFPHGNGRGQFLTYGTVPAGTPIGSTYGDFYFSLANVEMDGPTNIGPRTTVDGTSILQDISWWKCAKPGATYALVNRTTGQTVVGPVAIPGEAVVADPACGTTAPVQQVVEVELSELIVVKAGEDKAGSITQKDPVVGATLVCTPAGAIQGWVTCEWVLDPETPTVKYVFAEGDGKLDPINLGEYSESVPNPGIDPAYIFGDVESVTPTWVATLVPEGQFNQLAEATVLVSGHSAADGSIITVSETFIKIDGTKSIVSELDLTGLCGTVQWAWLKGSLSESANPQNHLFSGGLTLAACDPSKWDDEDDNEHPEQPPAHPWHPGHGHGHHHNGGWNGHAGGPDFNGPAGTPGDLSSNVGVEADSSANTAVVQASSSEVLGMGSALPDVSYWSNDSDSVEDELAATGVGMSLSATIWTVVLLIAVGVFVYRVTRRRPKHRMAR